MKGTGKMILYIPLPQNTLLLPIKLLSLTAVCVLQHWIRSLSAL